MSIDWSTAPEGAEWYGKSEAPCGSCMFFKFYDDTLLCSKGKTWEIYNDPGYLKSSIDFVNTLDRKPLSMEDKWPEEARIDIIGTNGNTGESYSMTKSATDYLSQGMKILSERGKEYSATGEEERSFPQVAQAFTAITGRQLSGSDVCLILNLVKKVRQYSQPNRLHEDSLVDAVNYDALWCQELAKELAR